MSHDYPNGDDCNSPQPKVHVHAAHLSHDGHRGETVRYSLPRRFGAAQQRCISDDFRLRLGELMDDEVAVNTSASAVRRFVARRSYRNR